MRTLVSAVFVALVLAGCSGTGGGGDPTSTGGPAPQDIDIDEDAKTGAISGVVVDQAIRPVRNMTVTLLSTGANVTTGDDGLFVFQDLEPGTYFLTANGLGYSGVQASTDVQAGQVSRLRVQVQQVVFTMPYHETLHFTGYIEFSPGAAGSILNIIIDTGLGMENPLCSKCSFGFETVGLNVTTFVVDGFWEDALPQPHAETELYLEFYPAELDDGTSDIQGGFLGSPILEHYPIALWDPTGENETNVEWHVRLTGAADTVQYNQQYELFVTYFVDGPAPEGWSLATQGA